MGKVVRLPNSSGFLRIVEDLSKDLDNVTDAVIIYRRKPDRDGESARMVYHWVGDTSSIMCLGLARHMCDIIADYIKDEVREYEL